MLSLDIAPSPRLAALLSAMHLAAAASVVLVPLPPYVRALLLAGVVASAVASIGREALRRTPGAVIQITLAEDGRVDTVDARGRPRGGWLVPSFVLPALVVVRYRGDDRRFYSTVLMKDALDAESFRRLRVHLRWCRHEDPLGP